MLLPHFEPIFDSFVNQLKMDKVRKSFIKSVTNTLIYHSTRPEMIGVSNRSCVELVPLGDK